MPAERHLEAGEQVGLHLAEGTELFCAGGLLRVTTAAPLMLGGRPHARVLATGQGWRAGEPTRITLEAEQPSRYIIGQR